MSKSKELEKAFEKSKVGLSKQIDDLTSEKKKLSYKLESETREHKELIREKNAQLEKHENAYRRFEEAMAKLAIAEKEKKEYEDSLFKRQKELNSLLRENAGYKDELDSIRRNYGSLDEIHRNFKRVSLKNQIGSL